MKSPPVGNVGSPGTGQPTPRLRPASAEGHVADIWLLVSSSIAEAYGGEAGMTSRVVSVVMIVQRPGLHQIEDSRRTPGHQYHHLTEAGAPHLAGVASAVLGMGRALEAGQRLEVGFVLVDDVAAAGFGAVAEGAGAVGHDAASSPDTA